MTKKTISITVDTDLYFEAKHKIDNLSGYVNECLKGLVHIEDNNNQSEQQIIEEIKELRIKATENTIKIAIKENMLKEYKDNILKKKRELLEREKFKRWKCGVCKTLNDLESDRCIKCTLPTRKDRRTTEVYLNEFNEEVK